MSKSQDKPIHVAGGKIERSWHQESIVRLDALMVAYYLALRGVPKIPSKVKLPFDPRPIVFADRGTAAQIEIEISNAFFLRLKGLLESRIKDFPVKADWRTSEQFVESIGLNPQLLDEGDKRMFSHLCALRNCLAHDYGLVDEKTAKKIPELVVGRYVHMDETFVRNWFIFTKRIFDLMSKNVVASSRLH